MSQQRLAVEEFHGRGERTVKQEVFAHCSLIALTRLFTNRSEESWRARPGAHGKPAMQANFKNGLAVVAQHLEGLLAQHAKVLCETVSSILEYMKNCRQRRCPGHSYPWRSRKPVGKWKSRKTQSDKTST